MSKLVGKWDIVVHTYMGDQYSSLEVKDESGTLSGVTTDKNSGNQGEIKNLTQNGDSFSYESTLKIPIGEITFSMTGTIDGDTIKGVSKNEMGEFEFDGTRAE